MNSKEALDSRLISNMFSKQFEMYNDGVLQSDNRIEQTTSECSSRVRPVNHSSFTQLAGYENLNTNTFHLEPDKKNTYHNYPVLQDNGSFCSMNHQIFMNNTKRNVGFVNDEQQTNVDHIIPGDIPIFHKMNICYTKQ